MQKFLSGCVLALVLLAAAPWTLAQKSATEKAVTDLEMQWLKSQKTNDVTLLEPLLAAGVVDTGADGKVTNRTEALAQAKATKWTSAEYDDMKVMVYGDAAVAVGIFKGKGTDSSGKAMDENERFTDTWVKMKDGKWQCVATQTTPIK